MPTQAIITLIRLGHVEITGVHRLDANGDIENGMTYDQLRTYLGVGNGRMSTTENIAFGAGYVRDLWDVDTLGPSVETYTIPDVIKMVTVIAIERDTDPATFLFGEWMSRLVN